LRDSDIKWRLGKKKEAIDMLQEYRLTNPNNIVVLIRLAERQLGFDQPDQAAFPL
jgi:predicted Zn-dependent protease